MKKVAVSAAGAAAARARAGPPAAGPMGAAMLTAGSRHTTSMPIERVTTNHVLWRLIERTPFAIRRVVSGSGL
jgi:hypothetical protein